MQMNHLPLSLFNSLSSRLDENANIYSFSEVLVMAPCCISCSTSSAKPIVAEQGLK